MIHALRCTFLLNPGPPEGIRRDLGARVGRPSPFALPCLCAAARRRRSFALCTKIVETIGDVARSGLFAWCLGSAKALVPTHRRQCNGERIAGPCGRSANGIAGECDDRNQLSDCAFGGRGRDMKRSTPSRSASPPTGRIPTTGMVAASATNPPPVKRCR
jgi:hypothetical protein